ncbi:MAG: DUF4350 domain-containing protein [Blastocatellia bacterium]|nr:DUF4350 domain-containing protein [Blastocatellia bacterium]
MRRYLSIIVTSVIVIGALIAMSAAGSIELDRPAESEGQPIRSSYSTGITGTRAFYQLLEESGRPVARWRESYLKLGEKAADALLIAVGPFQFDMALPQDEAQALQDFISAGGHALIISRSPDRQFGDPAVHSLSINSRITASNPPWNAAPEQLVDPQSDELIVQPTELTKNLAKLALSQLAARMNFAPPPPPDDKGSITVESKPKAKPDALVIHLGDRNGAVLADFTYGEGRVVFLSDPFVIANRSVMLGSNLKLALNLIDSLGAGRNGAARRIYFDEYHHGYSSENNPLVAYFRGTPMAWVVIQSLLLSLLVVYSFGKRFARPLPLPQVDRHSPLEFVGSMANLQHVAKARDLAIENIFPRFKAQLCRRLGLSSRAEPEAILAGVRRRQLPISEIELRQALSESELVMRGEALDDAQLVKIVARMRRIMAQLK